jgi:hypothetical protein
MGFSLLDHPNLHLSTFGSSESVLDPLFSIFYRVVVVGRHGRRSSLLQPLRTKTDNRRSKRPREKKPLAADPATERSERVGEEAEENRTDMKHLRAVIKHR